MPFDATTYEPKRDPIEEARQAMLRRTAKPAQALPEHLRGVLFSQRDLITPALSAIDAEMAAFQAKQGRR